LRNTIGENTEHIFDELQEYYNQQNKVRFVVIGDSKGKVNGVNEKVLKKLLVQIKKLNIRPQYLVVLGDSICGSTKMEEHKSQLESFKRIILKSLPEVTIVPVVGNHEVNNEPCDDSEEKVFNESYSSLQTSLELQGYNKTAYCIDIGNIRLMVLNSYHYGEVSRIIGNQLAWFIKAAEVSTIHKFVFVHSPAYPTGAHIDTCLDKNPETRDEFWKVVDECNVDVIFSGHEHNYSRRHIERSFSEENFKDQKEIVQIISGGAGEKLKDKFKSKKGVKCGPKAVHHFLIVDVEENNVRIQAISESGKRIDEYSYQK
jgi:3',5'-cyclic-AMP phosphodiesterase